MEELFPMAGKILRKKIRLYMAPIKVSAEMPSAEAQLFPTLSTQLPVAGWPCSMAW
eukprot:CAMPEP_0172726622 /NCGR_PEP_ID=MMETSP1074-20121228/91158_1 /TAXON_ID=2916 /ORGANISM="Ceratium fusus, Strain PA161109" /LENGTH=55 /DNA_ID=CAMNT_0013553697 /DNA_START=1 /DNA_END=168 /DNA_ORIENTATION=-